MKPEEITTENWVEALADFLKPKPEPLTISIREALDQQTQLNLREMRDRAPAFTMREPEEVTP